MTQLPFARKILADLEEGTLVVGLNVNQQRLANAFMTKPLRRDDPALQCQKVQVFFASFSTWVSERIPDTVVTKVFMSRGSVSQPGFAQADLTAHRYPLLGRQFLEWLSPTLDELLVSSNETYEPEGAWEFYLYEAEPYYAALGSTPPTQRPARPRLSPFFAYPEPEFSLASLKPPLAEPPCTTPPSSTWSSLLRTLSGVD